jgi:hypothetical protein
VTICGREGDIYELLAWADHHQTGLLVRAKVNRCLAEKPSNICGTKLSIAGAWKN